MKEKDTLNFIKEVLEKMPGGWLKTTTHRLDIFNEKLAKTQFTEAFEALYQSKNSQLSALENLPTAYDYIRLGHPLSCVLEWGIAHLNKLDPKSVISFSSKTIPIMAVLRKNLLDGKSTQILVKGNLPKSFDAKVLKEVYGYTFELKQIKSFSEISKYNGSTIVLIEQDDFSNIERNPNIDFFISYQASLGSVLSVHGKSNESYISDIQHVRRRETIAMTPVNCFAALKKLTGQVDLTANTAAFESNKVSVFTAIKQIAGTNTKALIGSSGLSIQYAIMMGLVNHAQENHEGKAIKFIVPPNCYGGTNDQARRVAACFKNVEIVDLPVDGDNDMVQSIDTILTRLGKEDAIPYIIAEIPTNPRVEVPDLILLRKVLTHARKTSNGETAIDPVFILDQTFCPNVHFLGEGEILSEVRTIVYASGSKFPSGGLCTAGYCIGNTKTNALIEKIEKHLKLCDNEATELQTEILAKQLPSMNERIKAAYKNTRDFVSFISEMLPTAKINFVSEELAKQGFTPSVFSLDLPTKGATHEERENYKRALNLKLINLMITRIPNESKYCVSYGQLKGCYWTIPATSTQGTTKEGDKDYIARVALSPELDLELHKKIFLEFVESI